MHFAAINKAAYLFAVLNIIQGILFLIFVFGFSPLSYSFKKNIYNYTGLIFIIYALILYPVIGFLSGHRYPYSPTFGLPCPKTIFTFGVLLFADRKIPFWLPVIPLVWSLIGFMAALKLSVYEDTGLLVAGLTGYALILSANKIHSTN